MSTLQATLFEKTDFLDYKFPEPQYLGSKFVHRGWISKFIPADARTVVDAFSGSQTIAYLFKQQGKKVITNDFLNFNNMIGKALIENPGYTLDNDDIDILFSPNCDPANFDLMESLFTDLFFIREEARFLDSFRSNVNRLDNDYKQALAMAIMCRTLTRKVTMGHFAHTQALTYAADPARIQRNRSLIRPVKDIFIELLPQYNSAVFDNLQDNRSYNENIIDLLPKLNGVDLIYFDPPYCNSHADYQSFYHLLETFVEYWKDKQFVNGIKRYEPKRFSGFDKNSEAIASLKKMFELSDSIPVWILSYNDRSFPDIDSMSQLIKPFRDIHLEKKPYSTPRGGKGSVAGSNEVLLICKPKRRKYYEQI